MNKDELILDILEKLTNEIDELRGELSTSDEGDDLDAILRRHRMQGDYRERHDKIKDSLKDLKEVIQEANDGGPKT